MGTTVNYGIPYPEGTDPVVVHADIEDLALKTDEAINLVKWLKRAMSSSIDDPETMTEEGAFQVLSGEQAEGFDLPQVLAGFFENLPDRNGPTNMQTFLSKSLRPQLFARSSFSNAWAKWESLGFQSINSLRTTDTIDTLQPGKAYHTLSGQISGTLGLPSSGTVDQRGILMTFSLDDGMQRNNVGESSNALLIWFTLSTTPGIFIKSKISSAWREWERMDIGGIDLDGAGKGLPGQVNLWGSSTPAGMFPELADALNSYGVEVHQHSRGGQWASQTAANIGSTTITIPVVGGTIPASGPVNLDTGASILDGVDLYLAPEDGKLLGWLGGVHGEIVGTGTTFTDRGATFTRTNPGVAVTVSSPVWVPDTRTGAHLNIYNSSKNDLNVGRTSAHLDRAKAHLNQAVALWKSRGQEFLILTNFVNNGTASIDDGRTQIEAYNAYVRAAYPNNMVDMGLLITQQEMWQWTGLTPTAEDDAQQALGNMPPSIQGSGNHLNETGDQYLSHKIAQWMIGRKYISEGRVPFAVLSQQKVKETAGRTVHIWDHINQREQMIYGDTGLRKLTPNALFTDTGQEVTVSRQGSIVSVTGWRLAAPSTPAGETVVVNLPLGFRPHNLSRFAGNTFRDKFMAVSGNGDVTITAPSEPVDHFNVTFRTVDPWPTSLPGSAIGVIPHQ